MIRAETDVLRDRAFHRRSFPARLGWRFYVPGRVPWFEPVPRALHYPFVKHRPIHFAAKLRDRVRPTPREHGESRNYCRRGRTIRIRRTRVPEGFPREVLAERQILRGSAGKACLETGGADSFMRCK